MATRGNITSVDANSTLTLTLNSKQLGGDSVSRSGLKRRTRDQRTQRASLSARRLLALRDLQKRLRRRNARWQMGICHLDIMCSDQGPGFERWSLSSGRAACCVLRLASCVLRLPNCHGRVPLGRVGGKSNNERQREATRSMWQPFAVVRQPALAGCILVRVMGAVFGPAIPLQLSERGARLASRASF